MKDIIQSYFKGESLKSKTSLELITSLLDHQANEFDDEIIIQLYMKLIFQYSLSEQKLIELNNLKNKFLGIAAHDLRNPLSTIRGFSEMLLEGDMGELNSDQKEYLSIIQNVSNNMLKLLNDLLDISAIESGKLSLELTKSQLKPFIEDRIRLNKVIADRKNIVINEDINPTPDVLFDAIRMGQVIDNLLSNSIKFSHQGSNIYVKLSSDDKCIIIVKDEGPGISPEDQAKLFGEFQKLDAKPTGGEKSTGLGLSIVKKIVNAHNGNIRVESVLGQGASFIVELPLST